MIKALFFICLFLLSINISANAKIVMDLSKYNVNISRNFRGSDVVAFGVCDKNEDIVIVLKGGSMNFKVKKMHKKYNMWSVSSVTKFNNVPNIYSVYSNKKVQNLLSESYIEDLMLGLANISISDKAENNHELFYLYESFYALINHRKQYGLLGEYTYSIDKIEGSNLFRIKIHIPDRIKTGVYSITGYSIKDGEITGIVTVPLNVRKVGINGILYYLAFENSKTYAILVIFWSILLGWVTNYVIQAVIDKKNKTSA